MGCPGDRLQHFPELPAGHRSEYELQHRRPRRMGGQWLLILHR